MYTIESLLHLGNPTEEQSNILSYMLAKGYKSCKMTTSGATSGTRKYTR